MRYNISAGRVNGVHAPIGTVLGPKAVTREFVTVTGNDDQGVTVGYTQEGEMDAGALDMIIARGPASVTEHEMVMGYQSGIRRRLQFLSALVCCLELGRRPRRYQLGRSMQL